MALVYYGSGTTQTGGAAALAWQSWVSQSTAITQGAWFVWAGQQGSDHWIGVDAGPEQQRQRAQQWQWQREHQAEQIARYEQTQKLAQEARARAEVLLLSCLSQEQRAQYRRDKFFLVSGGKTGASYRISGESYTGNIIELDKKGKRVRGFCAHAPHGLPLADHLLTQKLMIQHHETEFLKVANARP